MVVPVVAAVAAWAWGGILSLQYEIFLPKLRKWQFNPKPWTGSRKIKSMKV